MDNNIINNNEDEDTSNNINRIKSIMIIKEIFKYIKDEDFPYKLFFYSKLFQKKFNIQLDNYKKKYQHLEKKIFEFLYLDSPLFKEIISDDTIYLYQRSLNDSKFINSYNNKLNKSSEKYSSLYYIFTNEKSIDDLKNLKINYNELRTMSFNKKYELDKNENYAYFFEALFSIINTKNNLIVLNISFHEKEHIEVIPKSFELENNLTNLRYLHISGINFNSKTIIKLNNLRELFCKKCENLCLSNIICAKLKTLYYIHYNKININDLISDNFKELKELDLNYNNISDISVLEKAKFENLEILLLNNNELSNINSLKNFNFKKLRILMLGLNNISDFKILEQVKFAKLEKIYLGGNKILDINFYKM